MGGSALRTDADDTSRHVPRRLSRPTAYAGDAQRTMRWYPNNLDRRASLKIILVGVAVAQRSARHGVGPVPREQCFNLRGVEKGRVFADNSVKHG
jgi:hypothetical protein